MSDSTTLERTEVKGEDESENAVLTYQSTSGEKLKEELVQIEISAPKVLQDMEHSKLQDSKTDVKEEQEMKEDATDERTVTRNNDDNYKTECSKTVDSDTVERMQEEVAKLRKDLKDAKEREQQETIQKLRLELAELKEAKTEIAKRERDRKEREELKREIERLKEEKKETTTNEKEKLENLRKEVNELREGATKTRTKDQYEELKKVKAKMEESASRVRTKTKIAELETEIRAEEARKREINRVLKLMEEAQAVDLCFLVDCTGSMQSYIHGVKENIQKIVEKSKRLLPDLNFSVAFVGYRDHCDGADRTVVLNFTSSILEFQSFMGSVEAKGGGDTAEDVFGGIEEVTKLSWSKQLRILFHIADSPCHGTRFHDSSVGDDYPEGDPRGLQIENLLSKLNGFRVIYWFAKLGNLTDLMVQVFQSMIKINEIGLASADALVDGVAHSISASVDIYERGVVEEVVREDVKGEMVSYKLISGQPDWNALEIKKVTVWKNKIPYDLSNLRKPLELLCEAKRSIKIATDPFAVGALRIAYYGIDYSGGEEKGNTVVLKQFMYTAENRLDLYQEQMEIQSVAIALANKFNSIKPGGTRDVHFADVSTITIEDGEKQNHFAMERYITGKYVKFNNNAGFVNETAYTATLHAFSHWTYWATQRYLMVVDLQGVKEERSGEVRYVLTDPAIHCGSVRRFGKTNLGREGMYKFFRTHFCNGICEAMRLKFHRFQPAKVYTDFAGATVIT